MRKTLQTLLFSVIISVLLIAHTAMLIYSPFTNILSHSLVHQRKFISLLNKTEKTSDDFEYIQRSLALVQKQSSTLSTLIKMLSKTLPLKNLVTYADSISSVSSQLPELLGNKYEAHYVLFFYNNYELRPGGGFIGSLGFITFKNYTLTKFEVQDVYEIDGQIRDHHEPHSIVRKYLNQPNEYLRDSNFSPDFSQNVKNALRYLESVPPYNRYYIGAIGVTTSAFEDLLRLTGPIELSDFQTTISSSNFFAITQKKIETNFFPGSKQKRSILAALGNAVRHKLEELPPFVLIKFIYRSITSKNLVLYFQNRELQAAMSNLQASGDQKFYYPDWILPVDTNVGVNKLNEIVHKTLNLQLIQSNDSVIHSFRSTYSNPISSDAPNKETFKNYLQLYLPKNITLIRARLNNQEVTNEIVTTRVDNKTIFGLYFETPPASSTSVTIEYRLPLVGLLSQIEVKKQLGAGTPLVTVVYSRGETKIIKKVLESDEVFTLR
ncbi:DUF4012 domain-containing protein [Candidatus Woesebacteria bacterium]|nr:DUF4012 domain-containing protein [Candidatus Woesebacteria bacterium]